ncbi:hypothetical protein G9A89_023418 [Geosiphon pyriformis]|nr:hypothetical protein G9A89_023418 [Geosiphon pyriformis]
MQYISEETRSGWLTKQGGNALRKTWKKRWCEIKGDYLYYYRQQGASEPAGVIHLSKYNTVVHDPTITKKSKFCIRIEKIAKSSDSVRSNLSYHELKNPASFIAYADSEIEMRQWISILQSRIGERNIVDIVLDRLDLTSGGHRRQGSYSSVNSFYSRSGSGSGNGSSSTLSSRRPSTDSMSLDTPSLGSRDSRKSSIESIRSGCNNQNGVGSGSNERSIQTSSNSLPARMRPQTSLLSNQIAIYGLGQPILRKPVSHSCLQERRIGNPFAAPHSRKLSLSLKEIASTNIQHNAPVIMVHGDNSKYTSSPDAVFFPDRDVKMRNGFESTREEHYTKMASTHDTNYLDAYNGTDSNGDLISGSPVTPIRNVFPSHLSDDIWA